MRRLVRRLRIDERGASLVLITLSMFVLLGAAALAVDLAVVRYDLRADRLASDAAAMAGASAIEPFTGSNAEVGCEMAIDYLQANIEDEGALGSYSCGGFASACVDSVARTVTVTAPPYTFEIVHPVPDSHPYLGSQALNLEFDGVACQRLGVRVQRLRDFTFGAAIGFDNTTTDVRSVARIRPDVGEGDVVPLVLLEPFDCDALTADGQGKVTVTHFEDSPGVIAADSDGSGACGASAPYIIEVQANGNQRWIRALPVPGAGGARSAILSYALSGRAGTVPGNAFNPADLTTPIDPSLMDPSDPAASAFQLYPEPTFRSDRVTRAPIDHRYNCKTSYPDYLGIPIRPCSGSGTANIDNHIATYGEPAGVPPPGGWPRWTTDIDTNGDCVVGVGETYVVTNATGGVWVDCPGTLEINGGSVTFSDVNAVFDGGLELKSDAVFEMNPSGAGDRWAYFREGGTITKVAQASINFTRTFVFMEDGFIDLVGGVGGLVWTAPTDSANWYEDMALWSDLGDEPHELGGQAGNQLTGTFFTPFANPFILKGQAGQLQTSAQFLTRKLEVTGFTEVRMEPDPESQTLIPIRGVALIR